MCTTVGLQMCVFAFPVQCVSFQAPHTAALTKLDKEVSERITKSSFIQRSLQKHQSRTERKKKKKNLKNKTSVAWLANLHHSFTCWNCNHGHTDTHTPQVMSQRRKPPTDVNTNTQHEVIGFKPVHPNLVHSALALSSRQ